MHNNSYVIPHGSNQFECDSVSFQLEKIRARQNLHDRGGDPKYHNTTWQMDHHRLQWMSTKRIIINKIKYKLVQQNYQLSPIMWLHTIDRYVVVKI